ncbi:MAG TPA: hypothetical protein VJB94_01575 [Candidatus Nanoarchaeia archaeon]|nr:hypothetical protein [Candidatus Nanoarchaeia archaeon]
MSKLVLIILLIQSIITFSISHYLDSKDIPSDEVSAAVYAGQQVNNAVGNSTNDSTVRQITANIGKGYNNFNSTMKLVSLIEFIVIIILLVISFFV